MSDNKSDNKSNNNIEHKQEESSNVSDNSQILERKNKLKLLREKGIAYPNDFSINIWAEDLIKKYNDCDSEQLEKFSSQLSDQGECIKIAGRMMLRRIMGKAAFFHIQDMTGRIQVYIRKNDLPENKFADFNTWDIGDILGISGSLFKTKTGELTIKATDIKLLTKSLTPLPDKFHGLQDQEIRYRQRDIDLIMNKESRDKFLLRTKIIDFVRSFLKDRRYIEVDTPTLQVLAGGAAAKPFETYHHSLDLPMFLRIAPELFLKRLVVGGFDRVFEISRNFRNEGLSTRHNPEFTTVEFYQAYATHTDLIELTETFMRELCQHCFGHTNLTINNITYDLSKPFKQYTLINSILEFNKDIKLDQLETRESAEQIANKLEIPVQKDYGLGKILLEIFEKTVEEKLMEPTFITEYPSEVSPLSRKSDANPFFVDRFEFFIDGKEIANGFSELNDPEDQAQRFKDQMLAKAAGDEEAMPYDEDYIKSLEVGLPPTAGEGIGIDRLIMMLTDTKTIKDVILFPHMRPK